MAFCGNCGKEISDHASFCKFCGAKANSPIEQKPIKEKKPVSKKIILLIVLAVVVAAAAITAGFLIKRANDKKKVAQAIKTARHHFEKMEYDKAIDDLALAIRIDPNNPDAYIILARSYEEIGDNENAEKNYKKWDKNRDNDNKTNKQPGDKPHEGSYGDAPDQKHKPSDKDLKAFLDAGRFYISINDYDAAKKSVSDGIALIPKGTADNTEQLSTDELIRKNANPDKRSVREQLFTMKKDLDIGYYEFYYVRVVNKSVDDTNPYGENTKTNYDYEYDESGRLFRITGHINGGDTDVIRLSYDDEGHLTGVTSSKRKNRFEYKYSDDGILKSVDTEADGKKSSHTYTSKDGNITGCKDGEGKEKTYQYKNGRVSGIEVEEEGKSTELKIKEENGLIVEVSCEGKQAAICEYDQYGNMTKISDADNILGEGAGTKTYEYKQIRVKRGSWKPNEYTNPTVMGVITRAQYNQIIKQTGHKGCEDLSKDPAEVLKELQGVKEAAIKELESYKQASAYRVAQQEELKKAIENGKKSIQGAMDKKDVESALASAKKNIDTIKTDAQLKEEEEARKLAEAYEKIAGSYSYVAPTGGMRQELNIQNSGTGTMHTFDAMSPEESTDSCKVSIKSVEVNGDVNFTVVCSGEYAYTYNFTYIAARGVLIDNSQTDAPIASWYTWTRY